MHQRSSGRKGICGGSGRRSNDQTVCPLVEATHGKLGFTAPLSAITAAVVGVILNLALFFAWHVLWPQGWGGRFDAVSALIAVAAAVALMRFKVGVLPLLGACALVGLASSWLLPRFS